MTSVLHDVHSGNFHRGYISRNTTAVNALGAVPLVRTLK